jgi:cytochrome c2
MAADTSGNIYLTIGVFQINGTDIAQSDAKLLGKIIKIDTAKGTWTTISKGHRNPQGLLITANGEIWSTEHGPAGGDELNRIVAGANYGWPRVTLGTEYGRYSWELTGPVGRHDGYEAPVFAWLPSIAASNLIEIKDFDPRWNGDFLVSSLKAQSLYRLRLDKGHVIYFESLWIGQRIRDITQLVDGTIALWTDDSQVLFLTVDRERLASNRRWPVALGETIVSSCMYCHHFGPTTSSDPAPSLSHLFGREIASDNYRYSAALRRDGKWTEGALKQFLADPKRFASGTSMPSLALTPEQIDEVVATLKRLDEAAQHP